MATLRADAYVVNSAESTGCASGVSIFGEPGRADRWCPTSFGRNPKNQRPRVVYPRGSRHTNTDESSLSRARGPEGSSVSGDTRPNARNWSSRCVAGPVTAGDVLLGALSVSGPARRFAGAVYGSELPRNCSPVPRTSRATASSLGER
jgi:hypothetical protein